ncbi:MAG: PadR family transcriptional regulator [Gammaproteobacteria bacterium]|nr:PadR family transcriptional regulator [Gammaproteobacteria bacterium]MDH5692969.1 PadR family transcriptional regulator [Gammaproteobacteria bacterium]
MSTIDLIVLGILLNNPLNAYELVRFIRERSVDRVLKISEPAVFKSCRRLANSGYLDGETVREQGVPDKVVYRINDKGRERLYELMSHFATNHKPFYIEFNTVIWNIENLERDKAREILSRLQAQLHQLKLWIIEHEEEGRGKIPFGPAMIVRQYVMTLSALCDWIDETVVEFDARSKT